MPTDAMVESGPFFSLVVPTRDRIDVLFRALASVDAQTFRDFEVVVVDDGSEAECATSCREGIAALDCSVDYLHLGRHKRGRGPAYVRNVGAWHARGRYLAFLDDDDEWLDAAYLEKAHAALTAAGSVDVLFANQVAVDAVSGREAPLWLHRLAPRLQRSGRQMQQGCYPLTLEDLAGYQGFCHLNTTICQRQFFNDIGGFDEYQRYEEDFEFYLRAVDAASHMLLLPDTVSRHYTAAGENRDSVSSLLHRTERLASRRQLLSKSMLGLHSAALRRQCRRQLSQVNRELARVMTEQGDLGRAFGFAAEATANGASLRWQIYTAWLGCRAMLNRFTTR
ncbi:glycosyltransferase family 2 protein [Parahaliea aestuarii]|uniref:Glycosyltransferase n=1 Tax=Parahaliea aestuarii TaxID=1852021 RepID=A0A5C8ZQ59_9GAMM|nr:glycosyltransferase family 2 protein [Parahaliea aestuarii]TXS89637.1 glycosyltransferase [Parahaliea aestuarii]